MNTLATLLLRIARRVGRWIVRRLSQWGRTRLAKRIRARVSEFRDRLSRARAPRRKRWLRFRISWRVRLLAWIEANGPRLTSAAVRHAEGLIERGAERVPFYHPGDSWGRWAAQNR